jgi:hypothetical protein
MSATKLASVPDVGASKRLARVEVLLRGLMRDLEDDVKLARLPDADDLWRRACVCGTIALACLDEGPDGLVDSAADIVDVGDRFIALAEQVERDGRRS